MPISKHYGGHGEEVMASMSRTYGDTDEAKRVFYATENKNKKKKKHKHKHHSKRSNQKRA